MRRHLTATRASVAPGARAAYLAAIGALAAHHRAAGGHFWLFERGDRPGEFLEFAEATGAPVVRDPALAARLAALAAYDAAGDIDWVDVAVDPPAGG